MDRLLYVGYYDTEANAHENRNHVLAASNKMTYICSAINKAGQKVEIVSASGSLSNAVCPGKLLSISEDTTLRLFHSIGSGRMLKRVIHRLTVRAQLFHYLMKHTKKDQPVLVYHSLGYCNMLRFLKWLKKFHLILEVEEIYSDVSGDQRARKREFKLFRSADSYIFPTELLNEKLNLKNKPYVIVCGTYQVEYDRNTSFDDDRIHLLYAGTFDPRKGGAQAAVAAAEELPENYHIHILGFGSKQETEQILQLIEQTNQASEATVTYDGLLKGEDYIRFLQSCHVGLSTQIPVGDYNETSFPSKVLSYLANGLRVVSVRLKVLERSDINHLMYYCEENTARSIADAVKRIDFSEPYNSRDTILALDDKLVKHMEVLLHAK